MWQCAFCSAYTRVSFAWCALATPRIPQLLKMPVQLPCKALPLSARRTIRRAAHELYNSLHMLHLQPAFMSERGNQVGLNKDGGGGDSAAKPRMLYTNIAVAAVHVGLFLCCAPSASGLAGDQGQRQHWPS